MIFAVKEVCRPLTQWQRACRRALCVIVEVFAALAVRAAARVFQLKEKRGGARPRPGGGEVLA
jgi:hypothetical protein